jgi:FixJ family two-component response regulator
VYRPTVNADDPVIAVVDDESPVRGMLGRLLRLADYQVSAFASGDDFLASLASRIPACAILDIHMPGLSGLDVQARLRAANLPIPVVFITASDDTALDDSASEAGAVGLLRKPFSSAALLEAIGVALGGGKPES